LAKMLLFIIVAVCVFAVNDKFDPNCPQNSAWSEWSWAVTNTGAEEWSSCTGSCGSPGEKTRTASRSCCFATCEGDDTMTTTESCVLDYTYGCGSDTDDFRVFDDTRCAESDRTYLDVVGGIEECRALFDASAGKGYMLECYGDSSTTPYACYSCKDAKLESSSCGSKTMVKTVYDWNHGIIWTSLSLGILTLIGGFLSDMLGWFDDETELTEDAKENNRSDPLYVPLDYAEGAICPCFPKWMGLSVMTFVMCMFGFTLGAGLNIVFDTADEDVKADWLKVIYYPGEIWTKALKLIVSPLISLMMVTLPDRVNVAGSKLGQHVVLFYIFTSSIAACEGLFWVNIIKPGDVQIYIDAGTREAGASLSELDSLLGIGRKAVPSNLFDALGSSNVLGLITFFLTLGIFMQSDAIEPEWREIFMKASKAALKGIMMVIPVIVLFTPFAMVSIITYQIAQIDDLQEILKSVGKYILTVFVAQGLHMFLFYPVVLALVARINPYEYFNRVKRAPLTAFATSSSAATLPVSLDVLKGNDVKWQIVDLVAPLGSAINMDGTSCGFPIMCMWIAQMNDYDVDAGSQIVLALLAMTCSVGTAPIPNAGVVYVSMLLGSLGGPFEDDALIAQGVAFILIFDWLVDRIETMQNVWSDCVTCKVFDAMGYDDDLKFKEMGSEMAETGKGDVDVDAEKRTVGV